MGASSFEGTLCLVVLKGNRKETAFLAGPQTPRPSGDPLRPLRRGSGGPRAADSRGSQGLGEGGRQVACRKISGAESATGRVFLLVFLAIREPPQRWLEFAFGSRSMNQNY